MTDDRWLGESAVFGAQAGATPTGIEARARRRRFARENKPFRDVARRFGVSKYLDFETFGGRFEFTQTDGGTSVGC
jgi:hypothetical protein